MSTVVNNSCASLKLLPLNALQKTGSVDHADWNYRFLLGYIMRKRYELILKLLGNSVFDNLLEIGYGSGVFMPRLKEYSNNIFGIDIHDHNESVMRILSEYDTKAELISGSAEEMPYGDNYFDGIISVSSLEFIENLDSACKEIKRILKKSGSLFVVTPGHSKILDLGLKILTGESARKDYGGKREKTMPILESHFEIKKILCFPEIVPGIKLYTALKLTPKK